MVPVLFHPPELAAVYKWVMKSARFVHPLYFHHALIHHFEFCSHRRKEDSSLLLLSFPKVSTKESRGHMGSANKVKGLEQEYSVEERTHQSTTVTTM